MNNIDFKDHPFRSKSIMAEEIGEIIYCLHHGLRAASDKLIDDLKLRAVYLEDTIQEDVLEFSEQIAFQFAYDPWHKITEEVQKSADRLISDLGLKPT